MAREVRVVIVGDASRLEKALKSSDTSLAKFGSSAKRHALNVSAALGGIALTGLAAAVKTAGDFDTAMRDVSASAHITGKALANLSDLARNAGLATGFGATEAAKALAELSKAGLSAADIGPALKGTLDLARAGEMDTAAAATAAADALNQFGLKGRDATKVADALTNASIATTGNVSDFALALSQGGGAAKAAGLSFGDTILALTELQRASVRGADAGTSLKSALVQIARPSTQGAAEIKRLGLNFYNAQGHMKSVAEISGMLNSKLGGMTQKQRLASLATIAGTDGMRALAAMSQLTTEKADKLGKSLTKQGSAAEVAKTKQSGFKGSMDRLKSSLSELGIIVGGPLAEKLADVADGVTRLFRSARSGGKLGQVGDFLRQVKGAVKDGEDAAKKLHLPDIVKGKLSESVGKAKDGFQAMRGAFKLGSGLLSGDWGKAWDGLKDIGSAGLDAIKRGFLSLTAPMRAAGKKIYNAIKGPVGDALDFLGSLPGKAYDAVKGLPSRVGRGISGLGSTLAGAARRGLSSFDKAFGGLPGKAFDIVKKVPGKISDAVSGVGSALADIGKKLVQGIVNGIKAAAGAIVDALKSIIPGPLRSVLGKAGGVASDIGHALGFRGGGRVPRFQGGGLVPAMVSPGELIAYGGGAMTVPGARVAADTVPMMLPVGAQVFTDHGQSLLAAGASPAEALAQQVPHFAKGGTVRGKVSTFGPPGEAAHSTAYGKSSAQAGIAVNPDMGRGTWNNARARSFGGKMMLVTIAGHSANLPVIDKGPSIPGRAIDVTGAGARKLGFAAGRFPTDAMGTASLAGRGATAGRVSATGSRTVTTTTDDLHSITAAGARRNMPIYRTPIADVSGVFDSARGGTYDAAERARLINEVAQAGAVNVTTNTKTLGEGGVKGGVSAKDATKNLGTAKMSVRLASMAAKAQSIASKRYDYQWGGGHNASFAPTHGSGHGSGRGVGYDCSGAVSAVLRAGRLLSAPLTSGALMGWGKKGSAKNLQVIADPSHTIMRLGPHGWFGTGGGNKGGGAGWLGRNTMSGRGVSRTMYGLRRGGVVGFAKGGTVAPRTGIAGNAPKGPRNSRVVSRGRAFVENLWKSAAPFYPAASGMPPTKFGAQGNGTEGLFIGSISDPDGRRKSRYVNWPYWALNIMVRGDKRSRGLMAETAIHEWAHHFQSRNLRSKGSTTEVEGGAQAFTRMFGNQILAKAGTGYHVQPRSTDTYGKYADQVRAKYGAGWVSKGQFSNATKIAYGKFKPDRRRRGGVVGMRTGGYVPPLWRRGQAARPGTSASIVANTADAIGGRSRKALKDLYGAGIRDNAAVTDALGQLQGLLGVARSATLKRLDDLRHELDLGIRRVTAASSPGGARVTRGEASQLRRSRQALSLVDAEFLKRAGVAAGRADRIGKAADRDRFRFDISQRMAGVDTSSGDGIANELGQLGKDQAKLRDRKAALVKAAAIAKKAGKSGREAYKQLSDEIADLDNTVADNAAKRAELARELPFARIQDQLSKIDLAGSLAGLTDTKADDLGVAQARVGELQKDLAFAFSQGRTDKVKEFADALASATGDVKALQDAIADQPYDEIAKKLTHFDFLDAMAALTPDTADDLAAQQGRRDQLQAGLDLALSQGREDQATQFAQALKAINDTLQQMNTADQEKADRDQALIDITKELVEQEKRTQAVLFGEQGAMAAAATAVIAGGLGQRTQIAMQTATPGGLGRY